MAEPDFRMKVGADVAASVNQFKQDLQDIVKQLESNPPKIKVKLDEKSTKEAANGIQKALKEAMDTKNTTQYTNALKQAYNLQTQLSNATQKYSSSLVGMSTAGREASGATQRLNSELQEVINKFRNCEVDIQDFKNEISRIGAAFAETKTHLTNFGQGMQQIGQYLLRFVSIQQVISQIENLVKTSVELDSSFTQLQIVTKESDGVMREFGNTAADVATRVGASIADVVDSATTFARLGYSLSESATLSEFTTMLQNVGDIDVSSAQNAITSIVKAFGDEIDISNIETVMDKLVTVGNGFPISVSQIAEGMTNASSALAAAGNSFDQSVALLTAANTTVQDAARSSTGLRTIAARLRNVKTELDDLGETMTEAKYQELVSSLTDAKVSLVDQNGELRSTYEILKDLAAVWDDLSSGEQAALATNIAGKRVPGRTEMCA